MRIVTIVGARPQFIKASAISRLICETAGIEEILVHTGQHYDENMSGVFFKELEIPEPDYHLGIGSLSHGAQTGRMLEAVEEVLVETKPDWVIIYGDTNSTLAGALAAVKIHIPVAHVEAGLRSFNRRMPEEMNRVLADHASDLLFAPTTVALENLRSEGIPEHKVHLVGDVMYDVALYYGTRAESSSRILEQLQLDPGGYILATVHRAENTDDPVRLRNIFDGLMQAADEIPVVLPLHPRTRKALETSGILDEVSRRIRMTAPLSYLDMVKVTKNACLVATDSGGLQKESFFHCVPCVTLREETEWVELVRLGWNRLAGLSSAEAVASTIREAMERPAASSEAPYGNGRSAEKILRILSTAG